MMTLYLDLHYLGKRKEGQWLLPIGDGRAWFSPGDPFGNRLEAVVGDMGDDIAATVFYAGIPVLVVTAGPTHDDKSQYEYYIPYGLEPSHQEVQALFFEEIGTLPTEGSQYMKNVGWESAASIQVHEGKHLQDLLLDSENEGHEVIAFVGSVADAMHKQCPDRAPEPRGF